MKNKEKNQAHEELEKYATDMGNKISLLLWQWEVLCFNNYYKDGLLIKTPLHFP